MSTAVEREARLHRIQEAIGRTSTVGADAVFAEIDRILHEPADVDPMEGAIDRLLARVRSAVYAESNTVLPSEMSDLQREVSWALNEAFRNGMRSAETAASHRALAAPAQPEHVAVHLAGALDKPLFAEVWTGPKTGPTASIPHYRVQMGDHGLRDLLAPDAVTVHVPGVPYESEDGQDGSCDWEATVVEARDPHSKGVTYALPERFYEVARERLRGDPAAVWVTISSLPQHNVSGGPPHRDWLAVNARSPRVGVVGGPRYPVYNVQGDPNAVAVGRFKASLRKFLGIGEQVVTNNVTLTTAREA